MEAVSSPEDVTVDCTSASPVLSFSALCSATLKSTNDHDYNIDKIIIIIMAKILDNNEKKKKKMKKKKKDLEGENLVIQIALKPQLL